MNLSHKVVSNEKEFETFREAVKSAGLPHQDLNYNNQVLISYHQNGALVGTGGLEIRERYGLLRSVSVSPDSRSMNFGKQITSDILQNAKGSNLDEVYLLTDTAKDYFEKLGFVEVSRDEVPEEIKSTTEFESVCPVSAACLVMKLK